MTSDFSAAPIKSADLTWHPVQVTAAQRQRLNRHEAAVIWFTGLSGSGKSTLANLLDVALWQRGVHSFVLDGDNLRHGLNRDLGFSAEDRRENIRRVGEVAALMAEAGLVVITAFISPYRRDRHTVRQLLPPGCFIETWLDCSLETCRQRDPKGLYRKAEAGEIKDFTGVSAPYEAPGAPEITLAGDRLPPADLIAKVLKYLEDHQIIPPTTIQEIEDD